MIELNDILPFIKGTSTYGKYKVFLDDEEIRKKILGVVCDIEMQHPNFSDMEAELVIDDSFILLEVRVPSLEINGLTDDDRADDSWVGEWLELQPEETPDELYGYDLQHYENGVCTVKEVIYMQKTCENCIQLD